MEELINEINAYEYITYKISMCDGESVVLQLSDGVYGVMLYWVSDGYLKVDPSFKDRYSYSLKESEQLAVKEYFENKIGMKIIYII